MREKGQITIEAIIIFGALILIFVGVSVPLAFKVKDAATDVAIVSDARYAAEKIVSAANSISTPGEKRTVEVYIPGYTSAGTVGNFPLIKIQTNIATNGSALNTEIVITRYRDDGTLKQHEKHSFARNLYGSGWSMSTINESSGRRYEFVVGWKNITWSVQG
ncbi:MAG: hypothetical protein QME59_03245 [Candidatus Hydrothermarchaeota archaeon]|nr:hypothetical protein [Candidatus Hydrothermarchaeota archaeon]